MKSVYKILFALVAVAVLCSCSKFLDEQQTTSFNEVQIYADESGANAAVIGCYAELASGAGWCGGMFEEINDISGLFSYKGALKQSQTQYANCTLDVTATGNLDMYSNQFAIVNKANDVLRNLDASALNQQIKEEFAGEARFLRAFAYFTLVRLWGRVPLVTTVPTNLEQTHVPFAEINQIYKLILDDLTFAEKNMRASYLNSNPDGRNKHTQKSRPDFWAATAIKAKVYAQIGCIIDNPGEPFSAAQANFTNCQIGSSADAWSKALATADNVINNGPYSLMEDYAKLFDWANHRRTANNKESILSLSSTIMANGGYTTLRAAANYDNRFRVINDNSSWGRVRPTREMFLRHWANEKYRKDVATDTDAIEISNTGVRKSTKPLDPRINAAYQHSFYQIAENGRSVETSPWIYGSDDRTDKDKDKVYGGNVMYLFPAKKGDEKSKDSNAANLAGDKSSALPYLNKYFDPEFNGSNKANADIYLLRLADMILVAAEAAAELGKTDDAVIYVNKLMKRARESNIAISGGEYPKDWTSAEFATKDELIREIMYERQRELMGEMQDNFDSKRRGVAHFTDDIAKPHNDYLQRNNPYPYAGEPNLKKLGLILNTPREVFGGVANKAKSMKYNSDGTIAKEDGKANLFPTKPDAVRRILLLPIPQAELDRNRAAKSTDQNFGY